MIAINDQYHVRGWRGLRGRTINACTRLLRHVEQAVGFFNFIMFSTIFSLGVAELGPLTGNGSGILSMAIVRGAIVPLMQGAIAGHIGITMPSSFP